jgi:hypothetical protein
MSAPDAIPENAESFSGRDRERLKEKLRKLLPHTLTDENKEGLEKIASGVRIKIEAERAKKEADDAIVSGLKILDPDLIRMHNVCEAHRVIGKELGRADGQPVRRIVKPPKEQADTPVQNDATEDLRRPEDSVSTETEQPFQRPPAVNSAHLGRKMKWDRLDEDSFIKKAVEEAGEFLPVRGGEAHPKAVILLSKLMDRLRVPAVSLAEAVKSDPTVSSPYEETGTGAV